jgi:hypothetical protein
MIALVLLTIFLTLLPSCPVHALPLPSENSQISEFLAVHNDIRTTHNASSLTWSTDFAAKAAGWAGECLLQLTGGILSDIPYGELQVAASGSFSIQDALNTFIQDECKYTLLTTLLVECHSFLQRITILPIPYLAISHRLCGKQPLRLDALLIGARAYWIHVLATTLSHTN